MIVSGLLPGIKTSFGLSSGAAGQLITVFGLGYAMLAPTLAPAVSKRSPVWRWPGDLRFSPWPTGWRRSSWLRAAAGRPRLLASAGACTVHAHRAHPGQRAVCSRTPRPGDGHRVVWGDRCGGGRRSRRAVPRRSCGLAAGLRGHRRRLSLCRVRAGPADARWPRPPRGSLPSPQGTGRPADSTDCLRHAARLPRGVHPLQLSRPGLDQPRPRRYTPAAGVLPAVRRSRSGGQHRRRIRQRPLGDTTNFASSALVLLASSLAAVPPLLFSAGVVAVPHGLLRLRRLDAQRPAATPAAGRGRRSARAQPVCPYVGLTLSGITGALLLRIISIGDLGYAAGCVVLIALAVSLISQPGGNQHLKTRRRKAADARALPSLHPLSTITGEHQMRTRYCRVRCPVMMKCGAQKSRWSRCGTPRLRIRRGGSMDVRRGAPSRARVVPCCPQVSAAMRCGCRAVSHSVGADRCSGPTRAWGSPGFALHCAGASPRADREQAAQVLIPAGSLRRPGPGDHGTSGIAWYGRWLPDRRQAPRCR